VAVLVVAAGGAASLAVPVRRAVASPADEARALNDRATAAFALNRFAEAAAHFEKAFELKPDPALLYNAAQSHRLAGNAQRALMLYQSYQRVYGNEDRRADVDARIRELKNAIAKAKAAEPSPAAGAAQPASTPSTSSVIPPPAAVPPASPATPTLVTQPPSADARGNSSSAWLWVAIGGAVIAAAAVTLLLVVKTDPDASIGVVR
jgi:tetratricopeptide (TPR) repeat protein